MEGLAGWGGVSGFGDLPGWLVSFTEALAPGPAVDDGPGRRPWRCRGAGGRALGAPRPGWSPLSPGPCLQGVQAQEQHHLQRQRHSVLPGVPQLPVPAPQVPRPGERLHSHPQHPGHGEAALLPPPPRPEGARLSCPGCPLARTAWGSWARLSACRTTRRPPPPSLLGGPGNVTVSPFSVDKSDPSGRRSSRGRSGRPQACCPPHREGGEQGLHPMRVATAGVTDSSSRGTGAPRPPGASDSGTAPGTQHEVLLWDVGHRRGRRRTWSGRGRHGGRQARAPRAPRDSQGTHLIPQQWV